MKKAFTLIELLIVIAIIAILALIAIPNFLEAQTRANVARVKADMRTVATAIEAYIVDNRVPPLAQMASDPTAYYVYNWNLAYEYAVGGGGVAFCFTTPIAYLTGRPPDDPFFDKSFDTSSGQANQWRRGSYVYYDIMGAYNQVQLGQWKNTPGPAFSGAFDDIRFNSANSPAYRTNWALASAGPDRTFSDTATVAPYSILSIANAFNTKGQWDNVKKGSTAVYDPTNGTVSRGNIWRLAGGGLK